MALEGGKTVVLAALGRPFSLGMLYDCRNDTLIPGKYDVQSPQSNGQDTISVIVVILICVRFLFGVKSMALAKWML